MTTNNRLLSEKQAFHAMSQFLEQYYERAGRNSELAVVLSDIQMLPDGRPADTAAWQDWLNAVRIVLEDAGG